MSTLSRVIFDIDTTPPTVPLGVTAAALSTSTIRTTWSASTDTGGSGLAGYRVFSSATLTGTYTQISPDLSTASLSYDDGTLSPSQARFYKISAFDGNGNVSAQSVVVSATTQSGSAQTGVRFNPGHWVGMHQVSSGFRYGSSQLLVEDPRIAELRQIPQVVGVKFMKYWRYWEGPTQGDYTRAFTMIDHYLDELTKNPTTSSQPKRLIMDLLPTVFSSTLSNIFPEYYFDSGLYEETTDGYVADVWNAATMDKIIALMRAVTDRYASNPYFEGIASQETALLFNTTPSSYSTTKWYTQFKRMIVEYRANAPTCAFFPALNYLGTNAQMTDLIQTCITQKAVPGGPDTFGRVWVENGHRRLQADSMYRNESYNGSSSGTDFRGQVSWKNEIQNPEIGGNFNDEQDGYGPFSAVELIDTINNINQAHYAIWEYNTTYGGAAQKWSTGMLPLIQSTPISHTTNPYAATFDFYISASGSDANAGTQNAPWAITALATKAQVAGKRIGLLNGTYNLSGMTPLSGGDNNLINVQVSATADTTVAAVNPRLAIIQGNNGASYPHNNSGLIGTTSNTGRLILDGLKITGFGSSGMVLGNSGNQGSATVFTPNITVRNCEFTGGDIRGTAFGGNHAAMKCYQLQSCLFENNWCHDNIARDGAGSNDHFSDILFFHQKDCIIRQCSFERSGGIYGKWSRSVNITVDRCYFDFTGYNGETRTIFDFNTFESGAVGFIKIRNNVVIAPQCADMRPTSNQLAGGTTNLEFVNNTIVHSAHGLIGTVPAGTANIYNNIFTSTASGDQSFVTINVDSNGLIDFNDYYNPTDPKWGSYSSNLASGGRTTYNYTGWKAAMGNNSQTGLGCDANSITTDPLFAMLGSKAFRYQVQAGSPALTSGRVNGLIGGTTCQAGAFGGSVAITQVGCDFQ